MSKPANNILTRSIVPLNQISDPSGCCQAIDLFIESIVCGRAHARAMIIDGPLGAGKRQVALAAAAEFGSAVVEMQPNSVVCRAELVSLLNRVGRDGVLVVHNFDELPPPVQAELSTLVTTGHACHRPNPYTDDPSSPVSLHEDLLQPRMLIATTNLVRAMPHPMVQSVPCFTLRRYRETIRVALQRRLRAADASCDNEVLNGLVDLIYLAPDDRFETVATILIGQADRCVGRSIDANDGMRLVAMCWGGLPTSAVVGAIQRLIEEQRIDHPDIDALAKELGVPAAIRGEVRRAAESQWANSSGGTRSGQRDECPHDDEWGGHPPE